MAKTISHPAASFLLAAAFLGGAWYAGSRAVASTSWPSVAATITGTKSDWRPHSSNKRNKYEAQVTYSYAVDGRTFHGTATIGHARSDRSARREAERYAERGQIEVLYDPKNPERSQVPGKTAGSYLWTVVLGVLGVACVGGGVKQLRDGW